MIPADIVELMKRQVPEAVRPPEERASVEENLKRLSIPENSELAEFFASYRLSAVLSKRGVGLLDLCSPNPEVWEATAFGRDVYGMPDEAVCLTTGEGEGFIFFSTRDSKVYELDVGQLDDYREGRVPARWDSFYSLMRWYLS